MEMKNIFFLKALSTIASKNKMFKNKCNKSHAKSLTENFNKNNFWEK